ncbi:MAG: hypothetical protein E6J55_01125, partial [Deltaproteobacteria bacterium]
MRAVGAGHRSETPADRLLGPVGTREPRFERVREMPPELRVRGAYLPDRAVDLIRDRFSHPLDGIAGLPSAATEPVRGRNLARDQLDLVPSSVSASNVGRRRRLLQLLAQLREAPLVLRGRATIEHRTEIAFHGSPAPPGAVTGLASGRDEVGDVDVPSGMREQVADVLQTFGVPKTNAGVGVRNCPVLTLAAEHAACTVTYLVEPRRSILQCSHPLDQEQN